jgi:hypothetical protein
MTASFGQPLSSFVSAKGGATACRRILTARIVQSGQFGGEPPWLPDLLVEENNLPENSSGNGGLIDVGSPFLRPLDANCRNAHRCHATAMDRVMVAFAVDQKASADAGYPN